MIVSHKHQYLFIEVPFTGSTAISKALRNDYDGEEVQFSRDHKHSNYSEWRRVARGREKKYFVFATVRNPLDLAVTDYMRLKNDHPGQFEDAATTETNLAKHGGWITEEHLERYNFIKDTDADFPTYFLRYYKSVYHNWYLMGHPDFGYVLRYEHLNDDFQEVLRRLSIPSIGPLPVVNKTMRKVSFHEYYTPETWERVSIVFGPFMKQWGYTFPDTWDVQQPRPMKKFQYFLLNFAVNKAARLVKLDPHINTLKRVKRLVN